MALAGCGGSEPATPSAAVPVVEVVDGDTLRVELDGRTESVRVIGIDTPEPYRDGAPAPCSLTASKRMRQLAGDAVELVADAEERDRYDRLLRYVERDGRDLGAELLREGLAKPLVVRPNDARAEGYAALARDAERERLGVWGGSSACPNG